MPNITPPSSPAPQVSESSPSSSTGTAIPADTRTHQKRQSHANRRKQRVKCRGLSQPYDYQARTNSQFKHQGQAEAVVTSYATNDAPAALSGYVGKNLETGWKRFVPLQELVGPRSRYGFDYKPWGGKCAIPITDKEGRVIAVLAGQPDDPGWDEVHQSAADLLDVC
ncbi:hypothetical protein ARMSODRAFT_900204 [Armillaria solidipes]|uniref:Uncharacterized protein n=1 Tax=Armillaria solidipes TaxID=1076256 RepID=A0A2H3AY64_9AGAR|nr:hypothetical protein ARMSODRAFT_900204 [Armillaria solidipes]